MLPATREGRAVEDGAARPHNEPRNENTAMVVRPLAPSGRAPLADGEREHAAWSAVLDRLHQWRAERLDEHALAVVVRVPSAGGFALSFAVASSKQGPAALVVGRHDQCDVVLPPDGGASLRHVAVLVWPSAGGETARVVAMDLRSTEGLRTHRGVARRVSSSTALRVGAGNAEVFALVAARDQPFAVRWRDELDAHVTGALVDEPPLGDLVLPALARAPDAWERSMVVRTGRAVERTDTLVVATSASALRSGVVLGRSERCRRVAAIVAADVVSRVHAMLFLADGALWLLDTASTGGTRIESAAGDVELGEGKRIVAVPEDARVLLADVEVGIDLG
jgi:hypothetical protein